MAYIDRRFYTSSYYGEDIPSGEFEKLAKMASFVIDAVTFGRAARYQNGELSSAIKTATAIQTEYMYANGGISSATGTGDNMKSSEQIGNYSYSKTSDGLISIGGIPVSPLALAVLDSAGLRYSGV